MQDLSQNYINGKWVNPVGSDRIQIINPATEKPIAMIANSGADEVNAAVSAARAAFKDYSQTSKAYRVDLLQKILVTYKTRHDDIAQAISSEIGAPLTQTMALHAATVIFHLETLLKELETFEFYEDRGTTRITKEAVGVCAFITPWNFPVHQVSSKLVPAIAAGCTMILKPSQVSSTSTHILAEVFHAAGVPAGVFNLVNGAGSRTGDLLVNHPDVDMVSFTGSTGVGTHIAKCAADTVKRVGLELGGKSANIIMDDADLEPAVTAAVQGLFFNCGQNCIAPSRMLVPQSALKQAAEIAAKVVETFVVGDPNNEDTFLGPLVSKGQWNSVQNYIQIGIDEGATLVCGGVGRPDGLSTGFYTKPTVFSDVDNSMTIAQEEIFGPVLCIIGYENEADAIEIANDSPFGLAGYVQSASHERAQKVGAKLRVGQVYLNNPEYDFGAPLGGFKRSGYGREWGVFGLEELLEVKATIGFGQ